MAAVTLKEVVDAMDVIGDDTLAYLNPKTGEIVTLSEDDRRLVEDEELDEEDLPQWQRKALPKIREVMESDEFLELPSKFEIHDWEIMERFAQGRTSAKQQEGTPGRGSRRGRVPPLQKRGSAPPHRAGVVSFPGVGARGNRQGVAGGKWHPGQVKLKLNPFPRTCAATTTRSRA